MDKAPDRAPRAGGKPEHPTPRLIHATDERIAELERQVARANDARKILARLVGVPENQDGRVELDILTLAGLIRDQVKLDDGAVRRPDPHSKSPKVLAYEAQQQDIYRQRDGETADARSLRIYRTKREIGEDMPACSSAELAALDIASASLESWVEYTLKGPGRPA